MAKEKSDKSSKKDKKEKKEKRSEKDGVSKSSKKEKKDKVSIGHEQADRLLQDIQNGQSNVSIIPAQEKQPNGDVEVDVEMENGDKFTLNIKPQGALVPFANPLADEKVAKKVFKSVKKGWLFPRTSFIHTLNPVCFFFLYIYIHLILGKVSNICTKLTSLSFSQQGQISQAWS
jgi:hypothetical protein